MNDSRESEMVRSVRLDISSPDNSASSSPLPENSSTDNLHHSLVPSASSSLSPPQGHDRSRAFVLMSIRDGTPHGRMLEKLLSSEKDHQKQAMRQKKELRRLMKDVYQIVSIYALLQGALFASVAQTTIFTCADWWGPVFIAGAVTVGVLRGVGDKLWRIAEGKKEARRYERHQSAVNDEVQKLYNFGSACSLDSLMEPGSGFMKTPVRAPGAEAGPPCIFSVHGSLVLLFLLGFSSLIIASCVRMLCSNPACTCGAPAPA